MICYLTSHTFGWILRTSSYKLYRIDQRQEIPILIMEYKTMEIVTIIVMAVWVAIGQCQCPPGYTDTPYDGVCLKTFDENCTTSIDCNIFRELKCDFDIGKCTCNDPSTQIFDTNRQSCVSLVGYNCAHDGGEYDLQCTANAFCDMPIIEGVMHHMCTCNVGWTTSNELLCINPSGYNDECSTDTECDATKFLKCDSIHKKCFCERTDEQIFDDARECCVSLVGFDCDPDEEDGLKCVDGGYCKSSPETNGGESRKCACSDGWTVTEDFLCTNRTGFDDECGIDLECNSDKILTCDLNTKTCVCQSPEQQIFDQTSGACVSLVGFGCDHGGGKLQCVQGAFCDMPMIDGEMHHICTCDVGWTVTDDLTCINGATFLFEMTSYILVLVAAFVSRTLL